MVKVTVEFDGETKVYEGDFFAGAVMAYQGHHYESHEVAIGEANAVDALCAIVHMAANIVEKKRWTEDNNENN